jgi:glycerol kinase
VKEKLHYCKSVYPRRDIVEHDPSALWQSFQLSYGRGLENVEDSKKYKTG